jgi:hypothetical protein
MFVNFMTIWNILRPFGIHNLWPFGIVCGHLVYIVPILISLAKINLATPDTHLSLFSRSGRRFPRAGAEDVAVLLRPHLRLRPQRPALRLQEEPML